MQVGQTFSASSMTLRNSISPQPPCSVGQRSHNPSGIPGLSFGGCKCSSDSSSAPSASTDDKPAATDTSKANGRSGKIDLGGRRNHATDDTASDDHSAAGEKPALPDDRRTQRLKQFDTDGDGKISDEERKAARKKRAEDMLKNADKNGDGKVTPDELAGGNFRRLDPATLDTDKDGFISADELETGLEARAKQWGAGRFGRLGSRNGADGGRMRRGSGAGGTGGTGGSGDAPDGM